MSTPPAQRSPCMLLLAFFNFPFPSPALWLLQCFSSLAAVFMSCLSCSGSASFPFNHQAIGTYISLSHAEPTIQHASGRIHARPLYLRSATLVRIIPLTPSSDCPRTLKVGVAWVWSVVHRTRVLCSSSDRSLWRVSNSVTSSILPTF
jgi:hypothetical protein